MNQRDVNWVTPLHEAAVHKSLPGLQFFIENEGDIHRQTKYVLFIFIMISILY